jgi:hypothetical protein
VIGGAQFRVVSTHPSFPHVYEQICASTTLCLWL